MDLEKKQTTKKAKTRNPITDRTDVARAHKTEYGCLEWPISAYHERK